MVKSRIESLGLYLPERSLTTAELVGQLPTKLIVDLEEFTGIKSRHVRAAHEDNFTLAMDAARDCLRHSRYQAADLDVIINCSISRCKAYPTYYMEPSMSGWLKRELGAAQALTFDVTNACAGMFTGVYILDTMIRAGMIKAGMVVSGECITPISDTAVMEIEGPYDEQLASLTVGDAGSAVIIDAAQDASEGIDYLEMMTCAQHADLCLGMASTKHAGVALYTQNIKLHNRENMMLWPYLQKRIQEARGTTFDQESFDYVILHQVGLKYSEKAIHMVQKYFTPTIPEQLNCLEECGNTASTSHFVVLYRELKRQKVKKGHRLLMVPSASGVVVGSMAVTIGDLRV